MSRVAGQTSPGLKDAFMHSNLGHMPAGRPVRRFRTYALLAIFILGVLWYSHHRSHRPSHSPFLRYEAVDWSRYAYVQYATSSAYLCNSVMIFEALQRLGSRAERVLLYPQEWDTLVDSPTDRDSQLLVIARDKYNVQLMPIDVQQVKGGSENVDSWDSSITKLLAFSQTQYDRVLHIDSDVTILQEMDDLFFLPSAKAAMPRAYWEYTETRKLTSLLVLIEPSYREFKALMDAAQPIIAGQVGAGQAGADNDTAQVRYDMELLNDRYGSSALVLPHRQYGLVTGEFRTKDHRKYLGNDYETWDPDKVLNEAKLVHFSDWPMPKPWVMWPHKLLAEMLPQCDNKPGTPEESGCRDREIWRELYEDFRRRRKDICRLLSYPAPDWPPRNQAQ